MNLGFFIIIFQHTSMIGPDTGWGRYEFFVFLSTTWIVNSLVQAFFMPNFQEFSELIRTGNLDFALVKPIDTQFLISFAKVEWSSMTNLLMGCGLLVYSLFQMSAGENPLVLHPLIFLLYPFYILLGVSLMYGVMIMLSATSVWLGRNQTLYNFWFYITNFYRYPMEIYQRTFLGWSLWGTFTFAIPILIVVNVPARLMAQPLRPSDDGTTFQLAIFALFATTIVLVVSRLVFKRALLSYRSASS